MIMTQAQIHKLKFLILSLRARGGLMRADETDEILQVIISRDHIRSLSRDPFAGLALDYLRALNLLNYQY